MKKQKRPISEKAQLRQALEAMVKEFPASDEYWTNEQRAAVKQAERVLRISQVR